MKKSLIVTTDQYKGIIEGRVIIFYDVINPQPTIDEKNSRCPNCDSNVECEGEWSTVTKENQRCYSCKYEFKRLNYPGEVFPIYNDGDFVNVDGINDGKCLEIVRVWFMPLHHFPACELRSLYGKNNGLEYAKAEHIKKYGQESWDSNPYIFLYEFKLTTK